MENLTTNLIIVYLIGIFIWIVIEQKIFKTESKDKDDSIEIAGRSLLWPIFALFLIMMLPIKILSTIIKYLNK